MKLGKAIQLSKSWEQILSEQGEKNILSKYLPEVKKLPCLIQCPYRIDKKPSLGLQFYQGRIMYKDFSTNEKGGLLSLIKKITGKSVNDICKDLDNCDANCNSVVKINNNTSIQIQNNKQNVIQIRRRDINDNDIYYWQSYGVNANILEKYGVYPIDYYWVNQYRFKSDKLAYAYRVVINSKVYYKIYQPYSQNHKWTNNYPKDTISLEKYISKTDKPIIICSSVKDALCLKCNISVDVCALQGEGYNIPQLFLDKYKNRKIFILFDNDKAGINYSKTLSQKTNIPYIEIPQFDEKGKDISDLYKIKGKEIFTTIMSNILKPVVT